jgi:large subunit ribosomal protein L17
MRHRVAGRTFGRRPEQRKALLRGLADHLLDHERITTTVAKAKELRKYVEPLVTLAKKGDLHARRQASSFLYRRETVSKLFSEIADRFKDRVGGYTRIYRLGQRLGDGAHQAMIELIPAPKTGTKGKKKEEPGSEKIGKRAKGKVTEKSAPKAKATQKAAGPIKDKKTE